jgi:hypothetical protein
MIIACVQAIPTALWFVFFYIALSAYSSLFTRIVWVPIAVVVPVLFLAAQIPLVVGLTYTHQVLVAGLFGLGLALGGSYLRPRVLRIFTHKRFEVAGDLLTCLLLSGVVIVKSAAVCSVVWYAGNPETLNCVSAAIGTLVPSVLLGRGLALLLYARIR